MNWLWFVQETSGFKMIPIRLHSTRLHTAIFLRIDFKVLWNIFSWHVNKVFVYRIQVVGTSQIWRRLQRYFSKFICKTGMVWLGLNQAWNDAYNLFRMWTRQVQEHRRCRRPPCQRPEQRQPCFYEYLGFATFVGAQKPQLQLLLLFCQNLYKFCEGGRGHDPRKSQPHPCKSWLRGMQSK